MFYISIWLLVNLSSVVVGLDFGDKMKMRGV